MAGGRGLRERDVLTGMTDVNCIGFLHDGQCQLVQQCDRDVPSKSISFFKMNSVIRPEVRSKLFFIYPNILQLGGWLRAF